MLSCKKSFEIKTELCILILDRVNCMLEHSKLNKLASPAGKHQELVVSALKEPIDVAANVKKKLFESPTEGKWSCVKKPKQI